MNTTPTDTETSMRTFSFFTWFSVVTHAAIVGAISVGLVVIWLTASPSSGFWPMYPTSAFGILLLTHVFNTLTIHGRHRVAPSQIRIRRLSDRQIGFEITAGFFGSILIFLWSIWAETYKYATDVSPPWPVWPTFAIGIILAIFLAVVFVTSSNTQYSGRIAALTESRAGVVEAQELELRRIERDLHDGAQARLVALNMQLGLAEQQLSKNPDAVRDLLRDARSNTGDALRELRNLARGIYPPVLSDRGLFAAISSLVAVSPLRIVVDAPDTRRLPAAVEGALYFVVTEALANATKHSGCTQVTITSRIGEFDVVLSITDNGSGGAKESATGLLGIRSRVEALDGRLEVTSPVGGPTTIRAELPCVL